MPADADVPKPAEGRVDSETSYRRIKEIVKDRTGLNVSNLYIAQVKGELGLEKRENYHKSKEPGGRVPQCPAEKRQAIIDAFREVGLLPV